MLLQSCFSKSSVIFSFSQSFRDYFFFSFLTKYHMKITKHFNIEISVMIRWVCPSTTVRQSIWRVTAGSFRWPPPPSSPPPQHPRPLPLRYANGEEGWALVHWCPVTYLTKSSLLRNTLTFPLHPRPHTSPNRDHKDGRHTGTRSSPCMCRWANQKGCSLVKPWCPPGGWRVWENSLTSAIHVAVTTAQGWSKARSVRYGNGVRGLNSYSLVPRESRAHSSCQCRLNLPAPQMTSGSLKYQ